MRKENGSKENKMKKKDKTKQTTNKHPIKC